MFESLYAFVEFDIEDSLKGSVSERVTLVQGGGSYPAPDWASTTLVVAPADPLLLPGDQAVLLLEYHESPAWFEAQPWTGQYRLDEDDRITANEFNPFRIELTVLCLMNS